MPAGREAGKFSCKKHIKVPGINKKITNNLGRYT
jgi:hypothetical protein